MLDDVILVFLLIFSLFGIVYLTYTIPKNDNKECNGKIFCDELNTEWDHVKNRCVAKVNGESFCDLETTEFTNGKCTSKKT